MSCRQQSRLRPASILAGLSDECFRRRGLPGSLRLQLPVRTGAVTRAGRLRDVRIITKDRKSLKSTASCADSAQEVRVESESRSTKREYAGGVEAVQNDGAMRGAGPTVGRPLAPC